MHKELLLFFCNAVAIVISFNTGIPLIGKGCKVKSYEFEHTSCPGIKTPWKMDIGVLGIRADDKVYVDVNITVNEDAPRLVKATGTVQKCDLKNRKRCSHFITISRKDVCKAVGECSDYYYVLRAIQPPLSCPLKKGNYTGRDIAFDSTMAGYVPGADLFYWKGRNEVKAVRTGKMLACAIYQGCVVFQ